MNLSLRNLVTLLGCYALRLLVQLYAAWGKCTVIPLYSFVNRRYDQLGLQLDLQMARLKALGVATDQLSNEIQAATDTVGAEFKPAQAALFAARGAAIRAELAYIASTLPKRPLDVRVTQHLADRAYEAGDWFEHRYHSLRRILADSSSPSFYADLLIWVFIPNQYAESLMGDILEQHWDECASLTSLRAQCQITARAVKAIASYVWDRIEKLAAAATLADLILKHLRKK